METLIGGLCSWDRRQPSHSQVGLICLCVTRPAENLSYLGCLALLVRKCHQGTHSACSPPSLFLLEHTSGHLKCPVTVKACNGEVASGCLNETSSTPSSWSHCPQQAPTTSLLVPPPILAHSSELPPCMIHSKPPCSHVPFLLLLQPLCLDPCLLCLRGSSQIWGRATLCLSSNP